MFKKTTVPEISVVIPTYRAGDALPELLAELEEVLAGRSVEYVVVDDRSPDDTWERLTKLSMDLPNLRAVRLQHNVGQMAATLCGIAESSGEVVVTMDDDLQHPPSEVPKLLAALDDAPEWDVVIGSWERGNDGWARNVGSRVFEGIQNAAIPGGSGFRHTGFRAFRRPVADALVEHGTRNPVLTSLVFEVAGSVHNVPVRHEPRRYGNSGFTLSRAVKVTIDNFVQSSTKPLRWIAVFGFVVALAAAVLGLVYLARAISGADTPPGWTSTFLAVVFFGGAILGTLGLLGRYVAVIMTEVRQPPRWVIRERIG